MHDNPHLNEKIRHLGVVLNAAFILFMIKVDAFVVYVSLPTIARDFAVNAARVSYVVVAYLLMLTGTMLIFGKMEDKIGVRKLQIAGYLLFTTASLLCGLAPGIGTLTAWRAVQGIGGAMMLTTAFASVSKYLPQDKKGWGMAVVTTAAVLGIATGAPLGGFITDFFSWRWIFFVNIPLGASGILLAMKVLPPDARRQKIDFKKFDFVGALLSFAGIYGLTYVMTNESGFHQCPLFCAGALAGSVLSLILFVLWEARQPDPLLDLRIFKNRAFSLGNIALFIIFMALSGIDFIIPFYLILAENIKTYQAGLFMFLYSVVYSALATYAGKLADEGRLIFLCPIAMFLASVACILFGFTVQVPGIWCGIIFIVFWATASAFFFPQNNRIIFINIPEDMQGVGSGVFNTFNNLSIIFGVCSFQLIFSVMTHSANIPGPQDVLKNSALMGRMFASFRNIFIFAGTLYLVSLIFYLLASRQTKK
jgi:EmrB/QacA subfamily drug resistance transporter